MVHLYHRRNGTAAVQSASDIAAIRFEFGFSWVLAHAEEYGFDTGHVFGVGDSAGGHYLGLYAAFCTNPDFAKSYPFQPPKGFAPTAVALNCGAFRVTMEDEELNQQTMQIMKEDLLPGGATEEELEELSVMNHVTPDFPPAFIMTCTGDSLKPLAPVLADKLAEQEVPFIYRFYGDRNTTLGHVRAGIGGTCGKWRMYGQNIRNSGIWTMSLLSVLIIPTVSQRKVILSI